MCVRFRLKSCLRLHATSNRAGVICRIEPSGKNTLIHQSYKGAASWEVAKK